ncbi:response regulator transcription factor [Candidatus Methylopumilus universalis]|uniref:Response regulator transcription factor n=1 Tax=Candidatus Methylopumilus universalis TaxID=2588536 RepID=A0AAX1F0L4_9PROT|nr:response regulator transcription factor [Candidatus Methylopumilus universalis]QDC41279.1 response regulator transcription factor [Candidatus Methylopumilus universalis]QDC42562.1 response regulator transcription factor [Candidatus Methylopumilus universalis]QDC54948.1 response regulator transcription factor [Candidatus Methylopumilus universalis]QDC56229.1 response regulator transcription factor [Candidatus Methylopumilus universalis]QDC57518.1 response regulator transcription factor [Cand
MAKKTTIVLVDDHAVVRAGVRRLLEQEPLFEVIGEAESGEKAYQILAELKPDVMVMDLSMPGMGGLEAIRRILMRYEKAKILVLSMHEDLSFANQALKLGAKGYLTKNTLADDLVKSIETVTQGDIFLSDEIAKKMAMQSISGNQDPIHELSAREFEIFRLLAEGLDIDAIASTLNISSKTVSNYQTMIKQKLDINTPIELIRYAIKVGVIKN